MTDDNGNHAATPGPWANFGEFLQERVGTNWVVARRTPRIIKRYGGNVVALSNKKYSALCAEYERLTLRSTLNPDLPSTALCKAAPALLAKCEKIVAWLDRLAADAEASAATNDRFDTLKVANIADAKNFRLTANDIRTVIAKAKGD